MAVKADADDSGGSIAVVAATEALLDAARSLAAELGLPLADSPAQARSGDAREPHRRHSQAPAPPIGVRRVPAQRRHAAASPGLVLWLGAERLELRSLTARGPGPVSAELVAGAAGRRLREASRHGELLARAAGLGAGTRTILDVTAGLGGDAALLALLGCRVLAVERHPVVAALLRDGVRRALADPVVGARLGSRLSVVCADGRACLQALASRPADEHPDVVLIDPMFPPQGSSAAPRREMQIFRALIGADADADELLQPACAVARRRVVVKRHAHAPPLAGRAPDVVYRGRSTRFDAYLRVPR